MVEINSEIHLGVSEVDIVQVRVQNSGPLSDLPQVRRDSVKPAIVVSQLYSRVVTDELHKSRW